MNTTTGNIRDYKKAADKAQLNKNVNEIIAHLRRVGDICRGNEWYASASYSNLAADTLFHMLNVGDKAQRPDYMVMMTDIHYGDYPDADDEECD